MSKRIIFLVAIALLVIRCSDKNNGLYVSRTSDQTGITFSNQITYSDSLSVIDFEYLYNGGGVGVIDINNDGLQDLYFVGNLTSSKLYLNKGNWHFEDITLKAHVSTSTWASGVTIADVNQDGFKDIYVSVSGERNTPPANRHNLLFINNGDLTFTEKAREYGLDDDGYGIQSTFFDYDLDGDLDMYLLRNSFVSYSRNAAKPKAVKGEAMSNDKLFRNNGDLTFTDVTKEAGILIEGFGLGVTISDINEDGWPDIYVSNDFITNDLLWINNQNGTFTNKISEYIKHQTFNGMGNDIADYNNDGLVDIAVVDMLPEDNKRWKLTPRGNSYDEFENGLRMGYEPQYVRNTLQLNNGNGTFSEIGRLTGIQATEWSWSVLFADYDNDGWKDLFICNGYGKDITNLDFIMYGDELNNMGLPEVTKAERQAALNELPGLKIHNYMYRNKRDLTFENVSDAWGLSEPTFSNGCVYVDLDNDGDLDLVTNDIDGEAKLFESQAIQIDPKDRNHFLRIAFSGPEKNKEGLGTKVYLKSAETNQYQYYTVTRGYLSSVEPYLHFGLSKSAEPVSMKITWPDGKSQELNGVSVDQVLKVSYSEAAIANTSQIKASIVPIFSEVKNSGILFKHREGSFVDFKVQPTLPHMFSRLGPGVTVSDVNGDALDDLYISGASNARGGLFKQTKKGDFIRQPFNSIDSAFEETGVLFFDADGDSDQDLYISSGGSEADSARFYQDRLLLNDGTGNFNVNAELPKETSSSSCVVGADYDKDGDVDLFVGGRVLPGKYPMPTQSFLLNNESKVNQVHFKNDKEFIIDGMLCGALWSDFNNDGWIDLIVVGEFMPIQFYENVKGKLTSTPLEIENSSGWWNSITSGDFDSDGDMDYVFGNLGLNSHFKASKDEPLCIYAKDFNGDGRIDPLITYYTQGVKYLGHPRDILIDQINTMKRRFKTFTDYATKTFDESFLPEELSDAYIVCAQSFANSYLENLGDSKFNIRPLPLKAQVAPIYGSITDDFNGDGYLDLLITGNSYSTEVLSGRDDASIGLLLKGQGDGSFIPVPANESGFLADGDTKGIAEIIHVSGKHLIVSARNNDLAKVFQIDNASKYFKANDGDVYAYVVGLDGKKTKHEFCYGSTYLSSSSRSIIITNKVKELIVVDYLGQQRVIKYN